MKLVQGLGGLLREQIVHEYYSSHDRDLFKGTMCFCYVTVKIAHSWLSQGTILVSFHKTMSTVESLVRNTTAEITNPFL